MPRPAHRLAPALAILGSIGFAAAWILLASLLGRQCSWMGVLAALDAALLLRLARVPSGLARAGWGLGATALAIGMANWGIAATQMGRLVGLLPGDSLLRLGASHGWTLVQLANGPVDLAWLAAALVIAVIATR